MPALSAILSSAIETILFHPVTITRTETPGERFRMIHMKGVGFQGVRWVPGQTVQIYIGKLTKRAYTPMDLDPKKGSASFLVYLHGGGPGSAWASSAQSGDIAHVMRPKNSLDFPSLQGPAVFFGDETSLAAAQALHGGSVYGKASRYVLEVNRPADAEEIVSKLGVGNVSLIQKREDRSHLAEVVATLAKSASAMQSPQWVFTGEARAIQSIRKSLKESGVQLSGSQVKAYWAPGKTGMD